VFGARQWGIPSRFIAEIPANLTDWGEQPGGRRRLGAGAGVPSPRARATSWGSSADAGSGWESGSNSAPVAYRLGEDVSHPTFGVGVVTGLEPGGIVVIRFSRDRSERKLVADLAPLSRR
jgi:DNA helicase-2/ATP-dependent DNA helicase PcrA